MGLRKFIEHSVGDHLSQRPSHLHRTKMEQLQAQFTEHVLAENDVECEWTACDSNGSIIPAGQNRYYVYPKLDKNGIAHVPGKWCCKKCYMYYCGQKDTVIHTVPAATAPKSCSTTPSSFVPDVNSIRKSVNESQQQGNFLFYFKSTSKI